MEGKEKFRMTRQRRAILEEVKKVHFHPTADEVYERVRKKLPRVSLGTVYRNLEVLAADGRIQKLDLSGHLMRFDGNTENHYHLRCLGCGRVVDLPIKPIRQVDRLISELPDFDILSHRLELTGFCPACKGNRSSVRGQ